MEGIIAGMIDSGVSMYLPLMGRDFDIEDLHFVNSYMEILTMDEIKKPPEVACTQVLFWGNSTKGKLDGINSNREGSDVNGGLIAGRNMDGDVDTRKVTVTHLLGFAHEPVNGGL